MGFITFAKRQFLKNFLLTFTSKCSEWHERKIRKLAKEEIEKMIEGIRSEVISQKEALILDHQLQMERDGNSHELVAIENENKSLRNAASDRARGLMTPENYKTLKEEFKRISDTKSKEIIYAETGVRSNLEIDDYEASIQTAEKLLRCGPKTKNLLKKALESLNKDKDSVSLSTIKLIDTFSDRDIEKITELFRYTWMGSVVFFDKISAFLQDKNLCQPKTDNIDYLGKIFSNQRGALSDKAFKAEISKWPNGLDDKILVEIEAFVILTREGREIFNLLESEIEPMPEDYFQEVKKFLENKYKHIELEINKN